LWGGVFHFSIGSASDESRFILVDLAEDEAVKVHVESGAGYWLEADGLASERLTDEDRLITPVD
jgi:hypothetical protein